MEGIKIMKNTLQECKEIVARERKWNSESIEHFTDLANKMYYEQSEWVRVEDRHPDNGRTVMVADIESGIVDTGFQSFDQSNRFYANTIMTVTHWAELPASPPKQ